MYTKDKSNRITLRLNDEQFAFVKANADLLDVSPSEFLRMVCNAAMATVKMAQPDNPLLKGCYAIKEGQGRENDEANSDNIL